MNKILYIIFLLPILLFSFVVEGSPNGNSIIAGGTKIDALQEAHDVATLTANNRITIDLGHKLILNISALSLTKTESGKLTLSIMIGCALPFNTVVSVPNNDTLQFFGDSALAPEWIRRELTFDERERVSACMFIHASKDGLVSSAMMRGLPPFFKATLEEKNVFPVEEGAFFGNYFTAPGSPIHWMVCRGQGQDEVPDAAGLAIRVCAKEDPNSIGLSQCGMTFVGKCQNVCTRHQDFYIKCLRSFNIITSYVVK